MKYIIACVLLLYAIACGASMYMQIDKNGNTIYSDTPLGENSTKINAPAQGEPYVSQPSADTGPSSTITSNKPSTTKNSTTPQDAANQPYTSFEITSPKDQDTIQNQPTIPVSMRSDPELQPGDTIQLYIDGAPIGEAQSSVNITLPQIIRGTHQLTAAILNKDKNVIKQSNSITLFVHQMSVMQMLRPKG